jgi:hypothetical protein
MKNIGLSTFEPMSELGFPNSLISGSKNLADTGMQLQEDWSGTVTNGTDLNRII